MDIMINYLVFYFMKKILIKKELYFKICATMNYIGGAYVTPNQGKYKLKCPNGLISLALI